MTREREAVMNFSNGFKEGYDMGFKAGFEEASKLLPKGKLAEDGFSALCSVCGKDFAKDIAFGWMCYNDNCPSTTPQDIVLSFKDSMIG